MKIPEELQPLYETLSNVAGHKKAQLLVAAEMAKEPAEVTGPEETESEGTNRDKPKASSGKAK